MIARFNCTSDSVSHVKRSKKKSLGTCNVQNVQPTSLCIFSLSVSLLFFAKNQVKEILLDVEQRLPPRLKVIINSTKSEVTSFSNEIIGKFF